MYPAIVGAISSDTSLGLSQTVQPLRSLNGALLSTTPKGVPAPAAVPVAVPGTTGVPIGVAGTLGNGPGCFFAQNVGAGVARCKLARGISGLITCDTITATNTAFQVVLHGDSATDGTGGSTTLCGLSPATLCCAAPGAATSIAWMTW